MRNWHGNLSPFGRWHTSSLAGALSAYAVSGLEPPLVLDFIEDYYRTGGSASTFDDALNFSRAGNATMVDSDGVLKWAPHNTTRYSEDFSNSVWNKSNVTVVGDVADGPVADTTAARITFPSGGSARLQYLGGGVSPENQRTTLAAYFKRESGCDWLYLATDIEGYARMWVDLVNKVAGTSNLGTTTGTIHRADVTDVGDSWVFVELEFTIADSPDGLYVFGVGADGSTARVAGEVLISAPHTYRSDLGGMVDNPATGNSYVPTTDSARYLPRVGNHVYNGSEWVNEGLLLESEARVNLFTNSEPFVLFSTSRATVSADQAVSPDGTMNATKLTEDTTASNTHLMVQTGFGVDDTDQCFSMYVKPNGRSLFAIFLFDANATGNLVQADFNLVTERATILSVGSAVAGKVGVEFAGNGWYRIYVSGVANSGGTGGTLNVQLRLRDGLGNQSYTGDGSSGLFVYGAQIEAGSTPSSYIPTSGSTVTRAAETLDVAAADMPWSSSAVSIQMDGAMTGDTSTFARWYDDASNNILLDAVTDEFVFTQEDGGTVDTVTGGSFTAGVNVPFNIASRHGSTFINGAVDGTALTENDTPTALPDLSATDFDIGPTFMGNIGKLRVWSEDLTDEGIEEAST